MAIDKKYSPEAIEDKWYQYWMDHGYFHSEPDDREPYTVVIPPPNVTGVLHMGHMLNNTIQDILVRRARMLGKNACWLPGTDHASIATEAKVVNKLREEGIDKNALSREAFLEHAWEWTRKHGGIILEQLKKLGASCDWDRTGFTMDEAYAESVIDAFIDLYNKGYIYRGTRMVNWDPKALTAVSDEEVVHKEEQGKLYYVSYVLADINEKVTIATTRPETILGDTAICVHPEDERYRHLIGKKAVVPVAGREIPVIADDYVDPEFGTGCLKITPAHDVNDHEIGLRHQLEVIDILNPDGTLSASAGYLVGEDRFAARKKMADALKESGALVKVEEHNNKVGYSERTNEVIEPRLSMQWFVAMDKLAAPALKAVMDDEVKFHPPKFKNTYRHWMENVRDWCISRQLWWGHRIPAWYYGDGPDDFVVAKTVEDAQKKASGKTGRSVDASELRQDDDVLDTWFSSWLWPISTFDPKAVANGKANINRDLAYYYPTNDLVTAPEIMFFWVARMIMAGYEYLGKKPFSHVYYTGIVRDAQRRKMSKSLGNSPDPIELMKKHGADGVRVGMLLSSPAGNDLLFDEALCEQGRNFSNKIWNAYRLVQGWEITDTEQPPSAAFAASFMQERLKEVVAEINSHFDLFRISDALMSTYKLVWDDFCSWYLEMIKPPYQQPIDRTTMGQALHFFEQVLKLLHPFMPFISEELWQNMRNRKPAEALVIAAWPETGEANRDVLQCFANSARLVGEIRTVRKKYQIPNKESIELYASEEGLKKVNAAVVAKLGGVERIHTEAAPEQSISFLVGSHEFFVPTGDQINTEEELKKLEEELQYTLGFLKGVQKKLANERFVNNAPAQVVALERKKQADAEDKVKTLESQIQSLQN